MKKEKGRNEENEGKREKKRRRTKDCVKRDVPFLEMFILQFSLLFVGTETQTHVIVHFISKIIILFKSFLCKIFLLLFILSLKIDSN